MHKLESRFEELGIRIPEILIPDDSIADMKKWAVIACDQYTAQPEYWEEVDDIAGDGPSALRLILPEVYLDKPDLGKRIDTIRITMEQYLQQGILKNIGPGFVYVKRSIPGFSTRRGLLIALDLEMYDYAKGAKSIIRPTEDTVVDRLPPRVKIRSNACIELPHILVLIDDDDRCIIEPLENETQRMSKLYEFDLMKGGGRVSGYLAHDKDILEQIANGLYSLADQETFGNKYAVKNVDSILMYAVGDGNHSLAAAKAHWENLKLDNPDIDRHHPARYALVELMNIHDEGIVFEPIHRVLFSINPMALLESLVEWFQNRGTARCRLFEESEKLDEYIRNNPRQADSHFFRFVCGKGHGCIQVDNPRHQLPVGTLQSFIDSYLANHPSARIDYIHGDEVVARLGVADNNIGFYLPSMDKRDFFKTVVKEGVLPRKTFSMGEAFAKRYYIEARRIKPC